MAKVTTATPHYDRTGYLLHRLIASYIRPYLKQFGLALACMIVVAITTAGNAWLMQPALDEVFFNKNYTLLYLVPLAILVLGLIKGMGSYGQALIVKNIGQRIITDMQLALYTHLVHADLALLNQYSSGNLLSRFTNDIATLRRSVTTVFTGLAKELLTLIFLIGLMFYQNAILACIAFFVVPLAVFPVVRMGRRMRKISHQTQEKLGDFTEKMEETFQGIRTVKAYQQEHYEISHIRTIMEGIYTLFAKATRVESLASPIMEILGSLAIAAIIWYGGSQVIQGTTTPGAFFSFITALLIAYKPLKSISGLNTALQEGLAAAKRLFLLLDTQPLITDSPDAKPLVFTEGHITFQHVVFHYTPKKPALSDISFDVPAGKTVALVGPSGGGKSTIFNLLLRFYDPEQGTLTIDGQDIRNITLASLRSHISFVSQDVVLFDKTVGANIAYAKPLASSEEIMHAAQLAAAHDFIMELPQGYGTVIGQNGFTLSGGQRQRIAIARAILKNSPILLLDEATSALDTASEHHIQQALATLMKGRTTIVIAHRLSTVVHADIIYVLKKGKIVESGNHHTLLAQQGVYSSLYKTLEH